MGTTDIEWVQAYLRRYISMATPHNLSARGFVTARSGPTASNQEMHAERPAIERILNQFCPQWREENPPDPYYEWRQLYNAAMYCLSLLDRQEELDEKLGSMAPQMAADGLHPWIWEPARPQWNTGHYAEAVRAAAVNLNSRLQNKTRRRDVSDRKLVIEAFPELEAGPGRPRWQKARQTITLHVYNWA
jgi:hypothetical protein